MAIREVKFRIWDKHFKKFVHNFYFINITDNLLSLCQDEDYVVQQYTGFKDKNDKEIYEGDIIKCVVGEDSDEPWIYHDEIIYENGCFWTKAITDKLERNEELYITGVDEDEVIGNIFENPELLNNEKEKNTLSV